MNILKTYARCGVCGGDGVVETTSSHVPHIIDPCPSCNGTGYHENGKVDGFDKLTDIQDKQNDIIDKLDDILEKLNEPA